MPGPHTLHGSRSRELVPSPDAIAVTALNFGRKAIEETLDLADVNRVEREQVAGRQAVDILQRESAGNVSSAGQLTVKLDPF